MKATTLALISLLLMAGCGSDYEFAYDFEPGTRGRSFEPAPGCLRKEGCGSQKSLCGSNSLMATYQFRGKARFSRSFVQSKQKPVGALRLPGSRPFCTGTLVSRNLFLTAKHCLTYGVSKYQVVFNLEFNNSGRKKTPRVYAVQRVVEQGNNLDYAVIKLVGNPGYRQGWSRPSFRPISRGEHLAIIQHPGGTYKQVATGRSLSRHGHYVAYNVDTLSGSSGSGILGVKGMILGVHTNGGCSHGDDRNLGVPMSSIPSRSILRSL